MQPPRILLFVAVSALLGTVLPGSTCLADFTLGDPPPSPTDVSDLPRGIGIRSVTGGFTVNTDSREEVRSFYNAVFRSSDGVPMNTTADTASCFPGTNGTAFKESVLRRINCFRALAGLPASVTLDASESAKNQEAALLMSRNGMLSHFPTNTWPCFTANAANAASNSNLALGRTGADAISGYIQDPGTNNSAVGHRRWILYPQTLVMGTGDVPQQGGFLPANATWVFDGNFGGPRPATRTPYVAWPPAGFVPNPVVYPRWSLAIPGADFNNATVSMKSNGVSIAVTPEPLQGSIGENTLAWVPMGLNAGDFNTDFPFNGADTVYTVAVTNIQVGLVTTGYTYTVTVFNPAVPGVDYFPPIISGPSQPAVGLNNPYTFTAVSNATSYQWRATLRTPYDLTDGAETGLGNFTANTSAGYTVQNNTYVASGSWAFRLAHPFPPSDQLLTLAQTIFPRTNTTLNFKSRLTWATSDEYAKVQASTNSGSSWFDLYSQQGTFSSGEPGFIPRTISLTNLAGLGTQLRFNFVSTGSVYTPMDPGDGWFFDDVSITNAELAAMVVTNTAVTTNFAFNPSQPGTYSLEARALIFTEFPLEWGPVKVVNATTNLPPVIVLSRPVVTNNEVRLDFNLTSGSSPTFKLLQADAVGGPWITNAAATLTTNVPGASLRFTTPLAAAKRFYRVQAP